MSRSQGSLKGGVDEAAGNGAPPLDPPALDLDVLMARLREEVEARRRQSACEQALPDPEVSPPTRIKMDELLDLPDAEFVATAHFAILGRKADAREVGQHLDRLLLGEISRLALLRTFMRSSEARARGVRVTGLWRVRLGVRRGMILGWMLSVAWVFKAVLQAPKHVLQFLRRIDAIEERALALTLRVETLERELEARRSAKPPRKPRVAQASVAQPSKASKTS